MMKKLLFSILILGLTMSSCTGVKVKIDPNLSPEEAEAVKITAQTIERDAVLESYQVVTGSFPLALADDALKSYRDELNKARIDYRTCLTRGLQEAADKNLTKIEDLQTILQNSIAENSKMSDKYIIVLAKIKEKKRDDGKTTGLITVFEQNPVKMVERKEITTPVVNNAVMIYQAEKGILVESTVKETPNEITATDPIMEFILSCDAK